MNPWRGYVRGLGYRGGRSLIESTARWAKGEFWADAEAYRESIDGTPTPEVQRACRQFLAELAFGGYEGGPLAIAALAWERFPDGPAADAYADGAGLADYRRCETAACRRGVPTPRSRFCAPCARVRQRAQQREYKHRQRALRPLCCTTRLCPQHKANAVAWRGYRHAWAAGSRGLHRIEWLFGLFGRPDDSDGKPGLTWLEEDAENPRPLHPGMTAMTPDDPDGGHVPWPPSDESANRWLANRDGENASLAVEGGTDG